MDPSSPESHPLRPPVFLTGPLQRQLAASYILEAAPEGCVVVFYPSQERGVAFRDQREAVRA